MSSKEIKMLNPMTELLTDESKHVLIGYHKIQMKREQLINPAESAILPLLDLLDEIRLKWKHAEDQLHVERERADRLDQYNIKFREEQKEWRNQQREMAGQVSMLQTDKANLEELIRDQERRLASIKKLIHQNLNDTVEYDKLLETRKSKKITIVDYQQNTMESSEEAPTDDEVRLRYNRGYRRSQSIEPVVQRKSRIANSKRTRTSQFEYIDEESENTENDPQAREPSVKRSRSNRLNKEELITTVTTITMDASGKRPTRGSIEVHKVPKKRSVSASRILDDNSSAQRRRLIARSPRIANAISNADLRHKTPTGIGSSWTRGLEISKCVHKFVPHKSLIGSCSVCNRHTSVLGKTFQCNYCKICVHDQCKSRAPVPCLPIQSFPATPSRNADAKLALPDFCPINPPYIPAIIIRCVCALEENRLNTEGIYRIPGNKEDVLRLYKEFNKYIPNLALESTEVITSCIKHFLNKKLKDPLIPRSSYSEFMKAAHDDDRLIEAISELPEPNRDTLAYLCLHLQKVAMNSAKNKMPIENLAISLCPTILSTNSNLPLNTLGYNGQRPEEYDEVDRQRFVLERLLKMPPDFWSDYLNSRTTSQSFSSATPLSHTPALHRVPRSTARRNESNESSSGRADRSVLGPVSSTPPLNFTPTFAASRRIKEPLF